MSVAPTFFNPDAGPAAIVSVFLFGLLGVALLVRPQFLNGFFDRYGPPSDRPLIGQRAWPIRIFGVVAAFLGFLFFFGLLAAAA